MPARHAKFDIQSSLQMASNITDGLNHIHEENCKHGDMKPHSVLFTSESNSILQQHEAGKRS